MNKELKFLEFNTLCVVDRNSIKFFGKCVKGNRIDTNTTIHIDNLEFDLDYIVEQYEKGYYRLINSNFSLIVEKT